MVEFVKGRQRFGIWCFIRNCCALQIGYDIKQFIIVCSKFIVYNSKKHRVRCAGCCPGV